MFNKKGFGYIICSFFAQILHEIDIFLTKSGEGVENIMFNFVVINFSTQAGIVWYDRK